MYTVDIDIGGTFTDGFFTGDGGVASCKVPTTPHDLTVCFMECIEEGARNMGIPLAEMLRQTAAMRLSTTVGTNAIITKSGPRIGLIITKGYETSLYGGGAAAPVIGSILPGDMVIGVEEDIDVSGEIRKAIQAEPVLEAVRSLVNQGARMIVASLRHASINPTHERRVKEAVKARYPEHYLRSVPLQLSTDVSDMPEDHERTNTALLNAYLHRDMARSLYRAEDKARKAGFHRPLLIVHSSGGVARVAKTHALQTYSSGPAAGLAGAARLASLYGLPRVLTTDMGGTSLDVGLVVEGQYGATLRPQVDGIPLCIPMMEVKSLGAGGGSIARVDPSGRLAVGPQSAGALPGPACYDKGGTEATVTDADVVLGYIDPDFFLGGRQRLSKERAVAAIQEKVAAPLGISLEEAALRIKKRMDTDIGGSLSQMLSQRGFHVSDFVMFAYGGAGPVHCCGYAEAAGISKIITFPFASVFSAYGASTMDVAHTYIRTRPLRLFDSAKGAYLSDLAPFNAVVQRLQERGLVDMRGEGFGPGEVLFSLDLVVAGEGGAKVWMNSPAVLLQSPQDVEAICQAYWAKCSGYEGSDVLVQSFMLRAVASTPHWEAPFQGAQGQDASAALKGEREVYWEAAGGFTRTRVYLHHLLQPGSLVQGPAVVEAVDTTYVISPGWRLTIDGYMNGIIERAW